jgi:hypothetical protein
MSQPQHILEGQRLRVEEGSSKRRYPNRDDSSSMNYNKKRENANIQLEEQL